MVNSIRRLFSPTKRNRSWELVGAGGYSGISLHPESPLERAIVYASIKMLSEDIAGLPIKIYKKSGEHRIRVESHALHRLLNISPDGRMTALTMRELLVSHMIIWGNAFLYISRERGGNLNKLHILPPHRVARLPRWVHTEDVYSTSLEGQQLVLGADEIMHLINHSPTGEYGYPTLFHLRGNLRVGGLAERYTERILQNSGIPSGILKYKGVPRENDRARLEQYRELWDSRHAGAGNAGKTALLVAGMEYQEIGHPPESMQLFETRKQQNREWAAVLRIPLFKLQDHEHSTFSNITELTKEYVTYALMPIVRRLEAVMNWRLLTSRERSQGYYIKHAMSGLLRGDPKARAEYYHTMFMDGVLSADEIRELEDMNPQPNAVGTSYYIPANMFAKEKQATSLEARELRLEKVEVRATRREYMILHGRRRLTAAWRSRIYGVLNKARKGIIDAVREAHSTQFRDTQTFLRWLREELPHTQGAVKGVLDSIFQAWLAEVVSQAQEEFGVVFTDAQQAVIDSFVASYTSTAAHRQIATVIALLGEDPSAEKIDEIETVSTGDQISETTRARNAVAREVYVSAGVTRVTSVAYGDSCPFCTGLDGKTVRIYEPFAAAGSELVGSGGERLSIRRDIKHPPYHTGCDCELVFGV